MEVGGQFHAPAALPLGKIPGTLVQETERALMDWCGKSRTPPTLARGPTSP